MKPFLTSSTAYKRQGAVTTNMYISTQQKKDRYMHTPGGRSSSQQAGCHWAKSLLLWWKATCAGWGRFLEWLRYSSVYKVCGGTHWGQAYALKKRGTEQFPSYVVKYAMRTAKYCNFPYIYIKLYEMSHKWFFFMLPLLKQEKIMTTENPVSYRKFD